MLLEGIFLPLTTPFHADGRVFLSKLEGNVERYSRTPAAGIVMLGAAGEGRSLTDRETAEVLRAAMGAAADEKVMIAEGERESVIATLAWAEMAAEAGYDAIALRGPVCCGDASTDLELRTFFETVADRSPLPMIAVGDGTNSISAATMRGLAEHPGVIGAICGGTGAGQVAEVFGATRSASREVTVTNVFGAVTGRMMRRAGTGDEIISAESLGGGAAVLAASAPRLKTRTKRVGFQVLAASTAGMLGAWRAGATGAVPRLGACAPQACCEVWQAFRDGDEGLAAEKQERVLAAAGVMEGDERRGIAALKYGCDLNGYFGGRPRLPLLPLRGDEREAVERALAGIRN